MHGKAATLTVVNHKFKLFKIGQKSLIQTFKGDSTWKHICKKLIKSPKERNIFSRNFPRIINYEIEKYVIDQLREPVSRVMFIFKN